MTAWPSSPSVHQLTIAIDDRPPRRIRKTARLRDDGVAIQDQTVYRQGGGRISAVVRKRRVSRAPSACGWQLSDPEVRLRAVAIELDLVHPALAEGSLLAQ